MSLKLLKTIRWICFVLLFIGVGFTSFFLLYANSLKRVNDKTVAQYQQLKEILVGRNYKPNVVVISARRTSWHNKILTYFGAANKSQHLVGNAIDILVFDINDDGKANGEDVDIVSDILHSIIGENGGIGTYKSEQFFWNRQMVHFDCRGYKARWDR